MLERRCRQARAEHGHVGRPPRPCHTAEDMPRKTPRLDVFLCASARDSSSAARMQAAKDLQLHVKDWHKSSCRNRSATYAIIRVSATIKIRRLTTEVTENTKADGKPGERSELTLCPPCPLWLYLPRISQKSSTFHSRRCFKPQFLPSEFKMMTRKSRGLFD
jgi:hypothetical protein